MIFSSTANRWDLGSSSGAIELECFFYDVRRDGLGRRDRPLHLKLEALTAAWIFQFRLQLAY
jgi:hypothetical protein